MENNRVPNRSLANVTLTATLAATLVLAGWATRSSLAENMSVIPSDTASKNAFVTNKGINWYTNLADAQAEAKKEGRLVFWVHMLGTMDGAT